ncbi:MAG: hypothetical protein, partial [Olavius algarvensis Gamma 1 endosymbiont]
GYLFRPGRLRLLRLEFLRHGPDSAGLGAGAARPPAARHCGSPCSIDERGI